jgi:hypothetical protein
LNSFDTLARHAIDPALDAIKMENDGDPEFAEFVTTVQSFYPTTRDYCLLTITHKEVGQPLRVAALKIKAGSDETVLVERSCRLVDEGKPQPVTTLSNADVTRGKIEELARAEIQKMLVDLNRKMGRP